ncbi:MAG: Holliday junction resolvase RuvX [Candidatus Bipolaricaulota bacterium]
MSSTRVLGLDWGTKRIGIAISDPSGAVAHGRESYRRRTLEEDVRFLKELVDRESVDEIVIGMPVRMRNVEGRQAKRVREFRSTLEENIQIPITVVDERLTSAEAERVLLEADLSRGERKKKRDQLAATLILQRYLNRPGSSES